MQKIIRLLWVCPDAGAHLLFKHLFEQQPDFVVVDRIVASKNIEATILNRLPDADVNVLAYYGENTIPVSMLRQFDTLHPNLKIVAFVLDETSRAMILNAGGTAVCTFPFVPQHVLRTLRDCFENTDL